VAIGAIGAIGLLTTIAGTGAGVAGQVIAAKGAKKAENARRQQARLEAQRARREIVRRGVVARAESLSNATNQGAQFSSAAIGAQGSAVAQAGRGVQATTQNEILGNRVFEGNAQQRRGNTLTSLGSGLQSFGSSLTNNLGTFEKVGPSLFA